jgi:hypothetical protein
MNISSFSQKELEKSIAVLGIWDANRFLSPKKPINL